MIIMQKQMRVFLPSDGAFSGIWPFLVRRSPTTERSEGDAAAA